MPERRREFVSEYEAGGPGSMAGLCRRYGISRPTGYKWVERWRQGLGLEDQSRAPRKQARALEEAMADLLLDARREHMSWGPRKLLAWLERKHPRMDRWPAPSTVGALIKREGLVPSRRRRARRSATPSGRPLSAAPGPNAVWCADFKGWFRMANGRRCEPLTISDQATRYLIRCQALQRPRQEPVRPLFEAAFREYGLPGVIRTDNGAPFGSTGLLGLSRLSVWWMRLGIEPERIEPGRPEQNGRHERMHRTLKAALKESMPARNRRHAQRLLGAFREEYNEERPHEGLENRTPGEVYERSARPYPERWEPMDYEAGVQVRRVQERGTISWHDNVIFLSEVLAGERVGLEWMDDGRLRVRFGKMTLADYDAETGEIRFVDGRRGRRGAKTGRPGRLLTRREV